MIEKDYCKVVEELSGEIINISSENITKIKLNPLEIAKNDDDK